MELLNSRSWTNEKHVKFLNSMEESFVRAMFEKKKDHRRPPRLDRYLPDTSDSTLDLKTSSRISKNHNSSQGGRMDGRCHKRSRMLSSQPSIASQDQVVPQIKIRTVDDKEHHNGPQLALPAPINQELRSPIHQCRAGLEIFEARGNINKSAVV